jgi:hypothetical protein
MISGCQQLTNLYPLFSFLPSAFLPRATIPLVASPNNISEWLEDLRQRNECITVCVTYQNDILVLDYVAGVLVSFDEEEHDLQLELSQRPSGYIQFVGVGSGSLVELLQRPLGHIQFEEVGSGSMAAVSLEQTLEWCSGESYLVGGTCSVAAWHIDLSVRS